MCQLPVSDILRDIYNLIGDVEGFQNIFNTALTAFDLKGEDTGGWRRRYLGVEGDGGGDELQLTVHVDWSPEARDRPFKLRLFFVNNTCWYRREEVFYITCDRAWENGTEPTKNRGRDKKKLEKRKRTTSRAD